MRCQHPRDMLERRWQDSLSAYGTCQAIQGLLVHVRIGVVRGIICRLKRKRVDQFGRRKEYRFRDDKDHAHQHPTMCSIRRLGAHPSHLGIHELSH